MRKRRAPVVRSGFALMATAVGAVAIAQLPPERLERFLQMSARADQQIAEEAFVGVTTGGSTEKGLFAIRSTGVSTRPVRLAASSFLDTLTGEQRERTSFPADDDEWRRWMNQHFYVRKGVSFLEMDEAQRGAAFKLLGESLSAKGLKLSRDIMKLNHTLGELSGDNFDEFGEWLFHITVMGEPNASEAWGWQLDGHHLIVNYFVLGDQVVMSPVFVGSEPVHAEAGKYEGTIILQEEQRAGLELIRALTPSQRTLATLDLEKTGNNNLGEALKDNLILDFEGVPAVQFSPENRGRLLELIRHYVSNLREGHAQIQMKDIERHLGRTTFAWIGETKDDSVFYYRIHSPVILIEFDHQRPANLRHLMPPEPSRQHIHAVVRTPNGNDYGKDLLRQHYEQHRHN